MDGTGHPWWVQQLWATWGHVIVACLAAAPPVFALTALLALRPGPDGRRRGWRDAVTEVGAVAGTVPFVWMILTPLPEESDVHLTPLHELPWYLDADRATLITQLGGNLAVFAAFGACAPVRWSLRLPAVALLAGAGSVTVEVLQYILDIGRVASVDDVTLNTAGAVLAALCTRPWWRHRRVPLAAGTGTVKPR